MPTDAARRATDILRDGSHFEWHVIPLLLLVLYVYANEIERRNWDVVFAGLALWGADWLNEIGNGLLFHATGHAPAWGAPGGTAYLLLIGLNVEISLMFAIMGVVVAKTLPRDRRARVLGLPNRWVVALAASALCVVIELWLNRIGALTWDYPWWSARAPWLIFVVGYLWFFALAFWVHDLPTVRAKARVTLGLLGLDAVALGVFGGALGWL
ncbi:MAG TPA: hypothetical protein VKW76_11230 [Candidatus Binatia bacterium]|nr:hypothetical protein [Candidatus Binatia bacterium]